MDNIQRFVDIFVRNFQPEPERQGNMVRWLGDKGAAVTAYFDGDKVTYIVEKNFKFDGTAESIPEELIDAVFIANGFIGEK